jgi:hypothetical protein
MSETVGRGETPSPQLVLELRSRKFFKAETDPDKRCTTVPGWPQSKTKLIST